MTPHRIRRLSRIAAGTAWAGGMLAAAITCAVGLDATVGRILQVSLLIAVFSATALVVEALVAVADSIPSAQSIACRALLVGQQLAREELEDEAQLARLSDYRSR